MCVLKPPFFHSMPSSSWTTMLKNECSDHVWPVESDVAVVNPSADTDTRSKAVTLNITRSVNHAIITY
ncbi:uncharacterized [Tachysurus ichikawai]